MLGAIFHADGDAQHQRHTQHIGRHRLPFRHLIENLIAGPPHKIAVHQFGHGASTSQGITNRCADDCGFRDRCIEKPVVGKRLRQTAIGAKGATPIAILLTKSDHSRVGVEAMQHRLENGFGIGQRFELRQRIALLIQAETMLARSDL